MLIAKILWTRVRHNFFYFLRWITDASPHLRPPLFCVDNPFLWLLPYTYPFQRQEATSLLGDACRTPAPGYGKDGKRILLYNFMRLWLPDLSLAVPVRVICLSGQHTRHFLRLPPLSSGSSSIAGGGYENIDRHKRRRCHRPSSRTHHRTGEHSVQTRHSQRNGGYPRIAQLFV